MAFYPLHPLQTTGKYVYLQKRETAPPTPRKVGVFYLQGASRVQKHTFHRVQNTLYHYISIP